MRFTSVCITSALAVIVAAAPLSAQAFEGRITFKVSSENGSSREMQYQVKDSKIRIDPPASANPRAAGTAIVMDPGNQKMLIMMPAQKMYMENSFAQAVSPRAGQQAGARATITATGKKETVAGYPCEHFVVTEDDGASVDACIAHGLGSFLQAPTGNPMAGAPASSSSDWSTKLGKDGFPLKVTKGNTTVMEVTKIEKMSLDPSLFAPPDGWKKFDIPNLPGIGGRRPPPQL